MSQEIKQNKMGVMPVGSLLVRMALPLMLSMLIQALYNIVDSIYVARISQDALTAVSLASPMQMIMISLCIGTSVGFNSLVSRSLGAREFERANIAAGNGLLLEMLSSLPFIIFGLCGCGWYFSFFTSNASIAGMGEEYLSLVMVLSLGVFAGVANEKLLQSTGKTMAAMFVQLSGAVTNIVLDPIMIFGRYGFPEMGVRGAALATVIGQFVAMAVGFAVNIVYNSEIKLRWHCLRLHKQTVKEIYRVGLPSIVMQVLNPVMTLVLNKILIGFTDTAVAVLGAYFKLNSFVYMPLFGINSAVIPIAGYNYGARDKKRIYKTVRCGIIFGCAIMALGTAAFELVPDRLLALFSAGEEMLSIGVHAFRVIGICFIPSAVSIIVAGSFQGIGKGYLSLINTLTRQLLVLLPSIFILAAVAGLDGVWWSFTVAEAVGFTMTLLLWRHCDRRYISVLEKPQAKEA